MGVCKDCKKRQPKCHSTCAEYLAERETRLKAAEKRLEEARLTEAIIAHKPRKRK